MNSNWRRVRLGKLLTHSKEHAEISPTELYKLITVRLWGKGIVLRDIVSGSELSVGYRHVARSGQFIVSRIDARHGAFGLVPNNLDGALVSSDFPVFNIDISCVEPGFLKWFTKSQSFITLCNAASEGTTNRVRLRIDQFESLAIPLPPLEEQRRIVAHIEVLVQRIEEARALQQAAMRDADALFEAEINKAFEACPTDNSCSLKDLTTKIGSGSTPRGGKAVYLERGIPFVRSLNIRMRRFQYEDLAFISRSIHERMRGTKLQSGDVLLNITGASIGRVACFPDDLDEGNVNQHVAIIRPRPERLSSRFLMYWLSQPKSQQYIDEKQKGGTRQGFTKAQIQAVKIPAVPIDVQIDIAAGLDELQSQVAKLKRLQEETQNDLIALLPSVLDRVFN